MRTNPPLFHLFPNSIKSVEACSCGTISHTSPSRFASCNLNFYCRRYHKSTTIKRFNLTIAWQSQTSEPVCQSDFVSGQGMPLNPCRARKGRLFFHVHLLSSFFVSPFELRTCPRIKNVFFTLFVIWFV